MGSRALVQRWAQLSTIRDKENAFGRMKIMLFTTADSCSTMKPPPRDGDTPPGDINLLLLDTTFEISTSEELSNYFLCLAERKNTIQVVYCPPKDLPNLGEILDPSLKGWQVKYPFLTACR